MRHDGTVRFWITVDSGFGRVRRHEVSGTRKSVLGDCSDLPDFDGR